MRDFFAYLKRKGKWVVILSLAYSALGAVLGSAGLSVVNWQYIAAYLLTLVISVCFLMYAQR